MNLSGGRRSIPKRLKLKTCAFKGCDVEFMARGKGKYCPEHQKPQYRKELYKLNDNEGDGIIYIEHSETYAKTVVRQCSLEGCECDYEITLIPRMSEYPSYCPEHRNEFKRRMFLNGLA